MKEGLVQLKAGGSASPCPASGSREADERAAGRERRKASEILENETKKHKPIETMRSALIFPQLFSLVVACETYPEVLKCCFCGGAQALGWIPTIPKAGFVRNER